MAALVMLAGCGGQQPATINPKNVVSITRIDGSATLVSPDAGSQGELPDNAQLAVGDHLYTAANHSVTLQFPDGSMLQLGPESHLLLYALRQADRAPIFRLLAGSVTADMRGAAFEVQAYEEAARNFTMVTTDLTAVPRSPTGRYQLGFDGEILKATVITGEFDLRSGNQQATLPADWQAIAEPGQPLQIRSMITPTPAPLSATEPPTATPIPIISFTPTRTPTASRTATGMVVTRTRTPVRIISTATAIGTLAPTIVVATPLPPATEKPDKPPKPTNPPPPQPTEPPPPQPTEPPPPPPTEPPRPTPGR